MKKRRIVLASILKPIDDTRMFEKLGTSLSTVKDYEVFIIGYPTTTPLNQEHEIHVLPLKSFKRISLGRILALWQTMKLIRKVKPELLIVNTHDLLLVSVVNRILFGVKIIYDIRENYYRNVLHTSVFPTLMKPFIAGWIRFKEKLLAPAFQAFLLAEKSYENELSFLNHRHLVLENKTCLSVDFKRITDPSKIRLLFSGTLAESTGIFQAIDLAKNLHTIDPKIELRIIGYCALPKMLEDIESSISNCPFISLVGGNILVPHHQIMDAIAHADFGLVSYPPSHHIDNRIPTKLYEYQACQLPILIQDYEPWTKLCHPYNAALVVDFLNLDPAVLLKKMLTTQFYTFRPTDVTWASEEPRFLQKIKEVLA